MGRTCATCGRERPHEAFGGKGEWARICRDCRRMPKAKLAALKHEEEIFGRTHGLWPRSQSALQSRQTRFRPTDGLLVWQIWCHRDVSSRAHSKVARFGTKTRWHFCWRQSSVVLRRSASRSCGDICWYQNSVSRK